MTTDNETETEVRSKTTRLQLPLMPFVKDNEMKTFEIITLNFDFFPSFFLSSLDHPIIFLIIFPFFFVSLAHGD